MLRPMIENMQRSIQAQSGHTLDPFSSGGGATMSSSVAAGASTSNTTGAYYRISPISTCYQCY
jgi:Mrp family chromosome partitioning ATPase